MRQDHPLAITRRRLLAACLGGLAAGALPAWAAPGGKRHISYYDGQVQIDVPQHIRRIATNWEAVNSILVMLGYGDRIVITTPFARRIPLFRRAVPGIEKVPLATLGSGHDINVEQILAAHPDIFFTGPGVPQAVLKHFTEAGIAVAQFKAQSIKAIAERTRIMGEILGLDAQIIATDYLGYFARQMVRVSQGLVKVPVGERVKIYIASNSPLRTSSRPSLDQDWMDLAGAVNVAEKWGLGGPSYGGANTGVEAVLAADPQVILCLNAADMAKIRDSPQWRQVAAVRDGRVYAVPKGLFPWSRESTEVVLMFPWLAAKLYPEAFADFDIKAETRAFYKRFYRLALTDADVAEVLEPKA